MSRYMSLPLRLPRELIDEIFELMSPHSTQDTAPYLDACAGRDSLAKCARVCRAFHEPAVKVLWREQQLDAFCSVVLANFSSGSVKYPESEAQEWGLDLGAGLGDEAIQDMIMPGENSTYYAFHYQYLPGPISDEDWSRFVHYAQFVRILRHTATETIDTSVFLFIQQRACGKPVFPNLRELVWEHATPELVSMISPSIRILRLPEGRNDTESGHQMTEFGFRMRRHAFKQLLPSLIQRLPHLEELALQSFSHEAFWRPFMSAPNGEFINQSIRTLHISESPHILMKDALPVISTIRTLKELEIRLVTKNGRKNDGLDEFNWDADWVTSSSFTFTELLRLRIVVQVVAVAALVSAIVAPQLEDVELSCRSSFYNQPEWTVQQDALTMAFHSLCRRNAASLRRLHITTHNFYEPLFPIRLTDTDAQFTDLVRPLLALRHLQDVKIRQSGGRFRPVDPPSAPALVAAWPTLRTLALPGLNVFPDSLKFIALTCSGLESLALGLLNLSGALPAMTLDEYAQSKTGPYASKAALRLLDVHSFSEIKNAAHVNKAAHFLISLFPHLDAERSSWHTRRDENSWNSVMDEVSKLQHSQRNPKPKFTSLLDDSK